MRHPLLLLAALCSAAPGVAHASETDSASPFVASRDPAELGQALECLTQAVYYEARNQSTDGQRAVAQVVLNRVQHPAYPNSVCGVVYQGSERVTGCQFTFTCDGSMYGWIEPYAWERAQAVARSALAGSVYRPVGLALNYHTTSIRPYWAPSLVRQAVIGAHVFYRRPNVGEVVQGESGESELAARSDAEMRAQHAVARRAGPTLEQRAAQLSGEIAVIEIPVTERPIRFRTIGGARATTSSAASSRRAAPSRSGTRVRVESGVRVARGS